MSTVAWMWCGAPSTTSLQPVFGLTGPAGIVRAAFSKTSDFSDNNYSIVVSPDDNNIVQVGNVTGLEPGVRYYYAAEIDGLLDLANVGRARTFADDSHNVKLTFASCWDSGLDNPSGAACAAQDPLMHLFLGDFGYPNINSNSPSLYRANYAGQLSVLNLKTLARNVAFDYVWDDHDFGPDNSDGASPGKAAAASTYRQCVPHYPLVDGNASIYHSFLIPIGDTNIRVIVTDLRYYRIDDDVVDDSSKTMMGATQKAWFKSELLAAKTAGEFIVWANSQAWPIDNFSGLNSDNDHWGAFATERTEIDNYRRANGITDMVILCGDAHSIGYKGSTDFGTIGTPAPVPTYLSAAMSRAPAYRPGPWDVISPSSEGDGHYSILSITKGSVSGWSIRCEFHHVTDSVTDTVSFTHYRDFNLPSLSSARISNTAGEEHLIKTSSGTLINLKRLSE